MSVIYTLAAHGDVFEQEAERWFLPGDFPSYERFWRAYVVPLTRRDEFPYSIKFKDDAPDHHVCIAELHYTVLRHLYSAYWLRAQQRLGEPGLHSHEFLARGFASLYSACDVAHELMGRLTNPGTYDAWDADDEKPTGQQARHNWAKGRVPAAIRELRDYRNHLTHGRFSPFGFDQGGTPWFPKPGTENAYFDWRTDLDSADLAPACQILDDAWRTVLGYLENAWTSHVLPLASK